MAIRLALSSQMKWLSDMICLSKQDLTTSGNEYMSELGTFSCKSVLGHICCSSLGTDASGESLLRKRCQHLSPSIPPDLLPVSAALEELRASVF